ncbi:MAG: glycosyltransferase [Saprospiraceae bacterium]|nr:glycosyltransferase [Saprospiraceae bacterium]
MEVHVLCSRRRGCPADGLLNGVWVHRAGFDSLKEVLYYLLGSKGGRGRVGGGASRPGWGLRVLTWLYKYLWKNIYFPDDAMLWYFPARRRARRLLQVQSFDAVLTVSLPFTGHLIGLYLRKRFPALPWLADMGDPFTIQAQAPNNSLLYGRWSRFLEKKILRRADVAVVTNDGAQRALKQVLGADEDKITVVQPLLHPEPHEVPVARAVALAGTGSPVLRLGYFGAFYAPTRTPDAFLDLLKRTFEHRPDWRGRLEVHVFGDIFPEFWDQLQQQPAIHLYGLRSRQDVRAAMYQMDLLLNIGNITDYQLPSKAVDYFASGKPVLHLSFVPSDPFVSFWGEEPGLLRLDVENKQVTGPSFVRWLCYLDGACTCLRAGVARAALRPFTVGTIGRQYLELLGIAPPNVSARGTVEVPAGR